MIKTLNIDTNKVSSISMHDLRDKLWWTWCWDYMQFCEDNPWATLEDYRMHEGNVLSQKLNFINKEMSQKFVEVYYPDNDFYTDCYLIWDESQWNNSLPWPLDIYWCYWWSISDIYVALNNKIPRDIVLERYDKHQFDYQDEETYWKVNLYSYWRINYDSDNYEKQKQLDIEKSRQGLLESSYLLDEALGQEKGTAFKTFNIDK